LLFLKPQDASSAASARDIDDNNSNNDAGDDDNDNDIVSNLDNESSSKRSALFRKRLLVFSIVDGPSPLLTTYDSFYTIIAYIYQAIIFVCILLSIITFALNTLPENWARDDPTADALELFVVIVFTIDYVLRLALTPYPRFTPPAIFRKGKTFNNSIACLYV
jgi:hypothetical protein